MTGISGLGVPTTARVWAIESGTPASLAEFGGTGGFTATGSVVAGTRLFLAGSRTGGEGNELFVTDGTQPGTGLVLDIASGPTSSTPQNLTACGNKVFFTAATTTQGRELWVSDGTPGGTISLGDLNPGTGSSTTTMIGSIGESLLFSRTPSASGEELWISDGTPQGTVLLKDIAAGANSSTPRFAGRLGDVVFLAARGAGENRAMWRTDGTEAGTHELVAADPYLGVNGTSVACSVVQVNIEAFFTAQSGGQNRLYRTNGQSAGTSLVATVSRYIATAGELVYFNATVGNTQQLSAFDPASGTTTVVNSAPPQFASTADQAYGADVDGSLIYTANAAQELWAVNARSGRAERLSYLRPQNQSGQPSLFQWSGDTIIASGSGRWRSGGTPETTTAITLPDATVGTLFGTGVENVPLFINGNGTGNPVFRFDPPYSTPNLIANRQTNGPTMSFLRAVGASNVATLSTTSNRQWQLLPDGTFAELDPINQPSSTTGFAEWNGAWYFAGSATAGANAGKYGLWRTLGTPATTEIITTLSVGDSLVTTVSTLRVARDGLVFAGQTAATGLELWVSDGTAQGTQMVPEFVGGAGSGIRNVLVEANGFVYAQSAMDNNAPPRLYETDGTLQGTRLLTTFDTPATDGSGIAVAGKIGANVVATVYDSRYGSELWFINPDGQRRVMDLIPGAASGIVRLFAAKDDVLYFSSTACANGEEIWRTDGTNRGTYVVTESMVGERPSGVETVRVGATKLFFDGYSDASGVELWSVPIPCRADVNGDGVVDFFDYLDFVASFAAGEGDADYNQDNAVDLFDYLDFVSRFATGC